MTKASRIALARDTMAIIERGTYQVGDQQVDIGQSIQRCLDSTQYFPPEALPALRRRNLALSSGRHSTVFEVANETTLAGIARAHADDSSTGAIAALNFASARNPGGGFLNGALAQEESLASRSALYASLLKAGEFYTRHRDSASLLYSDAMILSPDCPIFRDDAGQLLGTPHLATFITCPAPNAGAIAAHRSRESHQVTSVLRKRAEWILALAAAAGAEQLVLGAWGCGVFRNDPLTVASAFADPLRSGIWSGRFRKVIFSVLDDSLNQATIRAFELAFA